MSSPSQEHPALPSTSNNEEIKETSMQSSSSQVDITSTPSSAIHPSPPSASTSGDEGDASTQVNQPSVTSSSKKKKKGKKRKGNTAAGSTSTEVLSRNVVIPSKQTSALQSSLPTTNAARMEALQMALKLMQTQGEKEHKFWVTQPVPQSEQDLLQEDGYIEPSKPREEVRQDAYPLPQGFEWSTIDISDQAQNKEVYDLLSLNYVEDDEASFRFQYTAEFLQWALMPPGYHKEWHIGVRVSSNKKLIAFISGVPVNLRVRKNIVPATEINFLCVHKKLRSKRLAPVLIKEVTRQTHLKGIFQAIYTAGIVIPTPISTCRYYHRSLNVVKLVEVGFTHVPRNMTLARMIRVHALPDRPTLTLREIEEKDIDQVTDLLDRYMKRFDLVPEFSKEEVKHQFLSGSGHGPVRGDHRREGQVIWTYVVESPEGKITDFISFYSLPSTIIGNKKYPVLEAAYLYYYATDVAFVPNADENNSLVERVRDLVADVLVIAKRANFDVFNALTLMDNVPMLSELKFGIGDGRLNFYLYNWRTNPLSGMDSVGDKPPGRGVGVVML